jgi:hypothetical protein|tara:strand:- start:507 stop:866 length:360 start_codon:yes stop_codon:yes gene_type:complete
MAFEATGTLYKISDVQQITDSFRKREFVLEMIDGAYTQLIPFQLTQDNCVKVDDMLPGTEVKVTFNLRGREWINKEGNAKYFGSLDAWKVDRVAHETPAPAATPQREAAPTASNDDLPF